MSGVALFRRAATRPDELAVDDGRRRLARAELLDRATRWGRWWSDALGVPTGGGVAVVLPNRVEMIEVVLVFLVSRWIVPFSSMRKLWPSASTVRPRSAR